MQKIKLILFMLVFLSLLPTHAADFIWQNSLCASFRSYPLSGDLTAYFKQEGLLFDHRSGPSSINYGLWQTRFTADVAGAVELAAAIYPISFIRLIAGVGGTYRFYNTATFNCYVVNCQGYISKNRLGIGFVTAFGENDDYILLPEYNYIQVNSAQNSLPIGDETEMVLANPNGDIMDQYRIIFGKRFNNDQLGLLVRWAQFRFTGQHNEMQALLARRTWQDTNISIGLGRYASDFYLPGLTVFVVYEQSWGSLESLF